MKQILFLFLDVSSFRNAPVDLVIPRNCDWGNGIKPNHASSKELLSNHGYYGSVIEHAPCKCCSPVVDVTMIQCHVPHLRRTGKVGI